jgi:virulence factor Mce-like protein
MQKQAPTFGRIMIMATFTLSCFGLLLYLWSAFGGPVPLRPHGYRFHASFNEATQLAQEADVRISGVNVGKVKKVEVSASGQTDATIEVKDDYAPVPEDTKAILRQKTLLGETYVELTPGTDKVPRIPEGGRLAASRVADTVQLDEILRAFDPQTRAAFQTWQQDLGKGIQGHGQDFSDALGALPGFAQNTEELVAILNSQERATRELIRNTGTVFDALTESGSTLSQWITNSNAVLTTTARRNQEIRAIFRAFPPFIDASQVALVDFAAYAKYSEPLMRQLLPVGRQLSRALVNTKPLAPDFANFFIGQQNVAAAAVKGLPASERFLVDTRNLLAQLDPFLRNFNPFLSYLSLYKRELAAIVANDTAVLGATDQIGDERVPYLRLMSPVNPEALASYPQRQAYNRANSYFAPGNYDKLKSGLETFQNSQCTGLGYPNLGPAVDPYFPTDLRNRVLLYVLNGGTTIAPPCNKQGKATFNGNSTYYPHVTEDHKPSP